MKNTNLFNKLAGGLMIIIGIIELISNIQLFRTGTSFLSDKPVSAEIVELRFATVVSICIAVFFLVCGVGILMNKRFFRLFSFITIGLYVINAMVNGQLLFGQVFQPEISINITVALLIFVFLYFGRINLYDSRYRH